EDVAHVVAADDHHLETGFFGDGLQASRTHFAGRPYREPVAGDDERLAAMHAGAEVGHQIPEGASFPAFVEGFERLRHAVGGRGDLVGVDSVPFPTVLSTGKRGIPENQRLAADEPFLRGLRFCQMPFGNGLYSRAWLEGCTTNYVHLGRS